MSKNHQPQVPRHADEMRDSLKRQLQQRLNRVGGQVRGLQRMIEDARYCPDILVQLSAAHESLRGVGRLLLRNHLEHCATNAIRSGNRRRSEAVYDELTDIFFKHAR
jgi:DNA-binding FrmR family transcriptional regulator